MASPALNTIPAEIFQQIGSHLLADPSKIHGPPQTQQPSLLALALVSKSFYESINPLLVRNIYIGIQGRRWFREDINRWIATLSRTQSGCHVRRLQIWGYFTSEERDGSLGEERAERRRTGPMTLHVDPETLKPLIALFKAMPGLTDLHIQTQQIFHASVSLALQEYLPKCRIHASTRIRLAAGPSGALDDPDMIALATSPNLHSLELKGTFEWDGWGRPTFAQEAAIRIVSGSAPNIKTLCLHTLCYRIHPSQPAKPPSTMQWDAVAALGNRSQMGALTSLDLGGREPMYVTKLSTWSKYTDFTALRRLSLLNVYGVALEELDWAAQDARFPNLKHLSICFETEDLETWDDGTSKLDPSLPQRTSLSRFDDTDAAAARLIASLPPLSSLYIMGHIGPKTFDRVLHVHGRSLIELRLEPYTAKMASCSIYTRDMTRLGARPLVFSNDFIPLIQAQCPNLEHIETPIRRSKSDADEVAIYKTLGQMKRLQSLELTLDWRYHWDFLHGDSVQDDPSYDEFDRQPAAFHKTRTYNLKNGHIRDALLQAALDAPLAASIWHTIRSQGSKLQTLKLCIGPVDAAISDLGHPREFSHMIADLSRSYRVNRNVGLDDPRPTVFEVSQRGRVLFDTEWQRHSATKGPVAEVPLRVDSVFHVFEKIWPPRAESVDWRDDWSSVPLGTDQSEVLSGSGSFIEALAEDYEPMTRLQTYLSDDE